MLIISLRKSKRLVAFDGQVTVHREKFLTIKPTGCINFSNLFLEGNSTCFGHFLYSSAGVIHCTHSNGICYTGLLTASSRIRIELSSVLILLASCLQTCMTYTIAVCKVNNSWWWTEELSETCRVSFQNKFEKLVHLVGFIIRNWLRYWIREFCEHFLESQHLYRDKLSIVLLKRVMIEVNRRNSVRNHTKLARAQICPLQKQ